MERRNESISSGTVANARHRKSSRRTSPPRFDTRASCDCGPWRACLWVLVSITPRRGAGYAAPCRDKGYGSFERAATPTAVPDPAGSAGQLRTNDLSAFDHRLHLAEGDFARQVLHAAIGRDDDVRSLDVRQCLANARGHGVGRFHLHVAEVDHAEKHLLPGERRERRAIQARLRGFNGDLVARAVAKLIE